MITSLKPDAFRAADVLALYRLRWRIELGFKRLKSLIGLKAPPENDERSVRAYVLAHLLVILLLEPHISAFEDSPRWAAVARPGAWRLLRQLVATLLQAIIPEPTIICLRRSMALLRRHLHEPPRRRHYQNMIYLF